MAKPLPFKTVYERRVSRFLGHMALASRSGSTSAIHDMRTDLKQLRAFFDLVGSIDTSFRAERAFAPAQKLFKAAGRLRNLHVLEARSREESAAASLELSEYYNWLKELENREVRRFHRVCRRFHEGFFGSAWKDMCSRLEGHAGTRARKTAEIRLLDLIKEIQAERSLRRSVRQLHFLRARTKEARYTLEILQECGLISDQGARLNERLRDVHQSLGRWHDDKIVQDSLCEFRKDRTPGPLISYASYIKFSRRTKERQTEGLAAFEAAWAALHAFLNKGGARAVLSPSSPRIKPRGSQPKPGSGQDP